MPTAFVWRYVMCHHLHDYDTSRLSQASNLNVVLVIALHKIAGLAERAMT